MSDTTYRSWTCDRCGEYETTDLASQPEGWARVVVAARAADAAETADDWWVPRRGGGQPMLDKPVRHTETPPLSVGITRRDLCTQCASLLEDGFFRRES